MNSADLDQGGTVREWIKTYLGPTVGWILMQVSTVLAVTSGGIKTVGVGTTLVTVNSLASPTIQLPTAIQPSPAVTIPPGTYPGVPVTVVDIGGHAVAAPITILPFGTELIMGLASLTIDTNYGAYSLLPNTISGGWTQQ